MSETPEAIPLDEQRLLAAGWESIPNDRWQRKAGRSTYYVPLDVALAIQTCLDAPEETVT